MEVYQIERGKGIESERNNNIVIVGGIKRENDREEVEGGKVGER